MWKNNPNHCGPEFGLEYIISRDLKIFTVYKSQNSLKYNLLTVMLPRSNEL